MKKGERHQKGLFKKEELLWHVQLVQPNRGAGAKAQNNDDDPFLVFKRGGDYTFFIFFIILWLDDRIRVYL